MGTADDFGAGDGPFGPNQVEDEAEVMFADGGGVGRLGVHGFLCTLSKESIVGIVNGFGWFVKV